MQLERLGHPVPIEIESKARQATLGSSKLCVDATTSIDSVVAHVASLFVPDEEEPAARAGAWSDPLRQHPWSRPGSRRNHRLSAGLADRSVVCMDQLFAY